MNSIHVNLYCLFISYGGTLRFRSKDIEDISNEWVWVDSSDDVFCKDGYLHLASRHGRVITDKEATEALKGMIEEGYSADELDEDVTRRWDTVATNILFEVRRLTGFDEVVDVLERYRYVIKYRGKICDLHIQDQDPQFYFDMWTKLKDGKVFSHIYDMGKGKWDKFHFAFVIKEHFDSVKSIKDKSELTDTGELSINDVHILQVKGYLLHSTLGPLWNWTINPETRQEHLASLTSDIYQYLRDNGYTVNSRYGSGFDFNPKTGLIYMYELYKHQLACDSKKKLCITPYIISEYNPILYKVHITTLHLHKPIYNLPVW